MNSLRDRKAINIDKKYHSEYINLKKSSEKSITDSPFNTFSEIYLLSAIIGVHLSYYKPIKGSKEKIFDSNVFNEFKDLPLIYTIAFCKENNVEKLANDDYVLEVVEGYANAGFPTLLEEIKNNDSTNLLNLSIYIDNLIEKKEINHNQKSHS